MVEGHGGRMMVADTWHLAESDTHIVRLLGLPSSKCLEKMNFRKSAEPRSDTHGHLLQQIAMMLTQAAYPLGYHV
jgi:hypothetical protein